MTCLEVAGAVSALSGFTVRPLNNFDTDHLCQKQNIKNALCEDRTHDLRISHSLLIAGLGQVVRYETDALTN